MIPSEAIDIWLLYNEPKGNCYEASVYMNLAFPELKMVRGHYGGRRHWWNVTPHGVIVDATRSQFDFTAEYVAYCGAQVYGKCCECGGHVYVPGGHFCCEACEDTYLAMLTGGVSSMAKSTYFIDIFGTVLEHHGHNKPDAKHKATPGTVKKLDQLSAEGHKIVLMTDHPESDRTWIVRALHNAKIRYDQLMMDAGKHRHIIDDESPSVHHINRDQGLG